MPNTEPFDLYADEYEAWFQTFKPVYESEIEAIRSLIPQSGEGIEIGIGSGLFAIPLGISKGVEPSGTMARRAAARGLDVIEGIAEDLPQKDQSFDFVLMVTTVCFVDDVAKALSECRRILKPGGKFILAFVDKNSPVGRQYLKIRDQDKFYRSATFYSTDELLKYLKNAGFSIEEIVQTLFDEIQDVHSVQNPIPGYGKGSFVVIRSAKEKEN